MDVRPCDPDDLAMLLAVAPPTHRAFYRARFERQERGEATLLVAWSDGEPRGQVTLLRTSKYDTVRSRLGPFPEMNGLEATPTGQGTGTAIVAAAEDVARAAGATMVGLAVALDNAGARRLYDRLGYVEWPHGPVVDRWAEHDPAGRLVREHADPCTYLVKVLR